MKFPSKIECDFELFPGYLTSSTLLFRFTVIPYTNRQPQRRIYHFPLEAYERSSSFVRESTPLSISPSILLTLFRLAHIKGFSEKTIRIQYYMLPIFISKASSDFIFPSISTHWLNFLPFRVFMDEVERWCV